MAKALAGDCIVEGHRRLALTVFSDREVRGAYNSLSNLLFSRQFVIIEQPAHETGLGPKFTWLGESEVWRKNSEVSILILRREDMPDILVSFLHRLLIFGQISHHDVAGSPV